MAAQPGGGRGRGVREFVVGPRAGSTRRCSNEARADARLLRGPDDARHGSRTRGRAARLRLGLVGRVVRLRRRHAGCLDRRADLTHPRRHGHRTDGRACAGRDRDDRDDARLVLVRALPPGPWRVGAAGRRGLARPALRSAARAYPRGRCDSPAEIADGWIATFFSVRRMKVFRHWLDSGFRARGAAPAFFDVMRMVPVVVGNDVAACRAGVKARLALYVGGMGARGRNFYNDIACRYGYEDAAKAIQDLYLAGRKADAEAAVPDALVDEVALCGPRERIRELLGEWRASGVTTLMVAGDRLAARTMAELSS